MITSTDTLKLRDEIKNLIQKIEKRIESDENKRRRVFWEQKNIPAKNCSRMPVKVFPELQMWAALHKVSLVDLYQVPELYIYTQLRNKLFSFDNFKDDQPIDREIALWYGSPFEGTLFGLPCVFLEKYEPEDEGVILHEDCREVLRRIEQPDFRSAGIMPLVHRMYMECKELIPGNYDLVFTDFIQTPLQIGFHLTGMENFLVAFIKDPEGAASLLQRLMDIRVEFRKERARFLDIELGPGIFDNDAVGEPILSPDIYRTVVWPVEKELSVQEGGVEYWHSCGNTSRMMEWIRKLPNCASFHVSAWSDCEMAAQIYDRDQVLQISVHPIRDVLGATERVVEERITKIVNALGKHRAYVFADGFQSYMGMPEQIKKIQDWIRIATTVAERQPVH
jgi:hypothetical protein